MAFKFMSPSIFKKRTENELITDKRRKYMIKEKVGKRKLKGEIFRKRESRVVSVRLREWNVCERLGSADLLILIICVGVCLFVSPCVCVLVYFCVCMSMPVCVCVCGYVCLSVCMYVSMCVHGFCRFAYSNYMR